MKKTVISVFALLVVALAWADSFAKGSTVYVIDETARIKSSTGIFSSTVATVSYGDACTVLETKGEKTQVKVNGQTGWIASSSLSSKKDPMKEKLTGKKIIDATNKYADDVGAQANDAVNSIKKEIKSTINDKNKNLQKELDETGKSINESVDKTQNKINDLLSLD